MNIMPLLYETEVEMTEDGKLELTLEDLPFEKGTHFTVKLIPEIPISNKEFKRRMNELIKKCSADPVFDGMTKEEIIEELRRQREEMYD
jgi:hypothetical protein